MARGTLRAGFVTSPEIWSADSMPKNANIRSRPVSPNRPSGGMLVIVMFAAVHVGQPERDEREQRHDLREGRDGAQAGAQGGAAHIDERERREHGDRHHHAGHRPREGGSESEERVAEHDGHGRHGERDAEPEQHAAEVPDVGAEGGLDVGVRARRSGARGSRPRRSRERRARSPRRRRRRRAARPRRAGRPRARGGRRSLRPP